MTLFCFLWIPLFYMFWRSLNDESALEGGTWALVLGTIAAFLRFSLGSFVNPEGFGVSRWVSACVDVIAFPVALPFVICLVFAFFGLISSESNFTNYAFLWLIPGAAIRALGWSSQSNPILLIGVPVLWTAVIVGIGFFIRLIQSQGGWVIVPAVLGALALPLAAATSYWALFAQNSFLGITLLIISLVPMVVSLVMSFTESL
jgi:hypothetical protein